jgi:hypothetical protein
MPKRRKKHGVGTHSPTGERRDRKRLQAGPKQHSKELQMKRTEEEQATATTKLVRKTGRPSQDGGQRCVSIIKSHLEMVKIKVSKRDRNDDKLS